MASPTFSRVLRKVVKCARTSSPPCLALDKETLYVVAENEGAVGSNMFVAVGSFVLVEVTGSHRWLMGSRLQQHQLGAWFSLRI